MTKEPKRRGAAPAIGLILLAALSLITWLGTGFEAEDVQANHGVAMAIDVDSSGNTALALGSTQACRQINVGQVVNVDIIVTGVSDILSWEAYIKYNPTNLLITKPGGNGQNNNNLFLLQQGQPTPPGSSLFNTSETLPDSDNPGIYLVGAYDGSVIPGSTDPYPGTNPPQHGSGVLVRLEIQGTSAGFSSLQISPFPQGPGLVGPFIKDASGTLVGDGADTDPFVDNVSNGGIVVGPGACNDTDGDTIPDSTDNCPNHSNIDQANFDAPYGDTQGDACDTDDDNDGLADGSEPATCSAPPPDHPGRLDPDCDDDLRSDGPADPDSGNPIVAGPDNCISVANPTQTNTDGDTFGDACDTDDDNDGINDTTDNCPTVANANQANYDGGWGDTLGDLCDNEDDGDGYSDAAEANVGTLGLDHCGNTAPIPPPNGTGFPVSSAWPADLRSDGISVNKVNIQDLGSFTAPLRRINTSPGDTYYNVRWDLAPGNGGLPKRINVADLATTTSGATSVPLMFQGARAFGGPACTPP
jgi:hypothetical protein